MFWRGWGQCGRIRTDEIALGGGRRMRMITHFDTIDDDYRVVGIDDGTFVSLLAKGDPYGVNPATMALAQADAVGRWLIGDDVFLEDGGDYTVFTELGRLHAIWDGDEGMFRTVKGWVSLLSVLWVIPIPTLGELQGE
jgi:hypothetical protein